MQPNTKKYKFSPIQTFSIFMYLYAIHLMNLPLFQNCTETSLTQADKT